MVIEKLSDADEKVRAAACEALGRLKCNAAVYSSLSERTVRQLGERCRDRKVHVRKQATMALGLLYEQAYNDILTNNPIATQIFGGIPEMVLSLVYTNNPEVLSNAHIALGNHVFAPNAAKDDYQRALRLVFVLTSVSERAKIAFGGLMKLQVEVDRELLVYLQYSEKYDPNITSESNDAVGQRLQAIIQRLAERFPEPVRYSNYFTQLASYKDEALTRGLRTCITPSSDFRVIRKAQA
ncbi:Sister chromatid cohesion protein pds5, partial [Spiromyces aspiralis]